VQHASTDESNTPATATATATQHAEQPTATPAPTVSPHIARALKKAHKLNERLRKQRVSLDQRRQQKQQLIYAKLATIEKRKEQSHDPLIQQAAADKLQWMIEQSVKSSDENVIDVDTDDYRRYIYASPRPYWTMVVHQALDERYKCPICPSFHRTTKQIASIVSEQNQRQHNISAASLSAMNDNALNKILQHYVKLSADNQKSVLPLFVVEADISSTE
jgi:hypothetical protein